MTSSEARRARRQRRWWAGWTVSLLLAGAMFVSGVLDGVSIGLRPAPIIDPNKVTFTLLTTGDFPWEGFTTLVLCAGPGEPSSLDTVPDRPNARQVNFNRDWVTAHAGAPLSIVDRGQGFDNDTYAASACDGTDGEAYTPALDLAHTTYFRASNTTATIQANLQRIQDAVQNPATQATITAARSHVASVGAPELWADPAHLNPATGDQAFVELAAAAALLRPLARPPLAPADWPPSAEQQALAGLDPEIGDMLRVASGSVHILTLDPELGWFRARMVQRATADGIETAELAWVAGLDADVIAGYRAAWNAGVEALGQR